MNVSKVIFASDCSLNESSRVKTSKYKQTGNGSSKKKRNELKLEVNIINNLYIRNSVCRHTFRVPSEWLPYCRIEFIFQISGFEPQKNTRMGKKQGKQRREKNALTRIHSLTLWIQIELWIKSGKSFSVSLIELLWIRLEWRKSKQHLNSYPSPI